MRGFKDRCAMAGSCKDLNDMMMTTPYSETWGSKDSIVNDIFEKGVPKRGLDKGFESMNRILKFSTKDFARMRILSYAVKHNDLRMVRRARELWPELTVELVVRYDRFFFKRALTESGREVLQELRNWWGVDNIMSIISVNGEVQTVDLCIRGQNSQRDSDRTGVHDLGAVIDFMSEMQVPLPEVLAWNMNVVVEVLKAPSGRDVLHMLHSLRAWGMTGDDVRQSSQGKLWNLLGKNADALRVLATWGLNEHDASYNDCAVLRDAALKGRSDVLLVLTQHLGMDTHHAQKKDNEALREAAANGHAEVLLLLHSKYGLSRRDAQAKDNEALQSAAAKGHVNVLEVLHSKYGLSRQDAQTEKNWALREAAAKGHANVLRVLESKYKLIREDARTKKNEALRLAAANGHVEVLKVLKSSYGLIDRDARAKNNEALRLAAANGHVEVLEVLKTSYGLDAEDARAEDNEALRTALTKKNVEVLRVLKTLFELTTPNDAHVEGVEKIRIAASAGDAAALRNLHNPSNPQESLARARESEALLIAAPRGFVEVLRVLREVYGLGPGDARVQENAVLRDAAERGFSEVLQVLATDYGLTAGDARAGGNVALLRAAQNGFVNVLRVLATNFGLDANDARVRDNEPLKIAVYSGNSEMLEVLATNFRLDANDAREENNILLRAAVKRNHFNVLQVLARYFGLTPGDARAQDNEALVTAVSEKSSKALEVLAQEFKLTSDDARKKKLLKEAIDERYPEGMRILAEQFGLTREDALPLLKTIFDQDATHILSVKATPILRSLRTDYGLRGKDLTNSVDFKDVLDTIQRWCENAGKKLPQALTELVEGWGLGGDGDTAGRNLLKELVEWIETEHSASRDRGIQKYLDEKLGGGWDKMD